MLLLVTLLACTTVLVKTDTADSAAADPTEPSVFEGADYPTYDCCWPVDFYAYTRGGTAVAAVELDWSYEDPATRERHAFSLDPESTGNAWTLLLEDEDTVHDGSCDEASCAVRINAYDADGVQVDCMTRGGKRAWVDAVECRGWLSSD